MTNSPAKATISRKALCSECIDQGTCSLAQSLSAITRGEIPLKNMNINSPTLIDEEVKQPRQIQWYQPDAFPRKLRYEKCPFHQQKSFGCD